VDGLSCAEETNIEEIVMTILITGATGNIGGEVIEHLLPKQVPIRGLVRDRTNASKLADRGVDLAVGDLSQPDTLISALQGIETAFLVLPNLPNQVELECGFIDAAKRSGVTHIVKLSVMAAGEVPSTFQTWHHRIEQHLERSGINWTQLRPNMLMQNMRWFAQTIAKTGAIYNCVGDTPISHIDARDVAAVAAICLTEPGHAGQRYALTGAAAITFAQIAELFGRELDRSIAYVDLPPADLKSARLAGGEPEWYLDAELELFASWRQGAGTAVTDCVRQITHQPPTSYAEFAREYARTHRQDFFN
jgi:uncharacterized protein YbjT (DUF2867 family)